MPPTTPDARVSLPSGWCVAETPMHHPDGSTVWEVAAKYCDHRIVVWGRTRGEAWKAAYRMVDRIAKGNGRLAVGRDQK